MEFEFLMQEFIFPRVERTIRSPCTKLERAEEFKEDERWHRYR